MERSKRYKIVSYSSKAHLLQKINELELDGWKCEQIWYAPRWFNSRYEALITKELGIKINMDMGPITERV